MVVVFVFTSLVFTCLVQLQFRDLVQFLVLVILVILMSFLLEVAD